MLPKINSYNIVSMMNSKLTKTNGENTQDYIIKYPEQKTVCLIRIFQSTGE